ncbi:MAG: sigma-70 family RNA polymerase sigma factor, partial [Clostridia bacterium]
YEAYQKMEPRLRTAASYLLGIGSPDIDDALQNALIKAWLNGQTLQWEANISSWLLRIVKNECLDLLRRRKRSRECLVDDMSALCFDRCFEESALNNMFLCFALNKLNPPYSDIIMLYYLNGLKIREIAFVLNRPENTVKGLLCRARKMMQKVC